MKLFIVFACIAGSLAMPNYGYSSSEPMRSSYGGDSLVVRKPPVPIVAFNYELKDGQHTLHHESGDKTVVRSTGVLRDLGGTEGPVSVHAGSYSYVGDDGKTYTVNWTADENGFRATGDHLPTPPPIPEEIQKSLDANRAEARGNGYGASSYDSYAAPAPVRVAPVIRSEY